MNMQLCASRRRDWLQQYANAKSIQKFTKTFLNFYKLLQVFAAIILFYFILFYMCERHYHVRRESSKANRTDLGASRIEYL